MGIISFLQSNKKLISYLLGLVGLLVTLYQLHDHIYDSGYQAAITDIKEDYNKKVEKKNKEYQEKVQKALNLQSKEYEQQIEDLKQKKQTKQKVKKVKEYVYEKVEVPVGCDDLANNVVGVLSKATGIVDGTYNESSEDTNTSEISGKMRKPERNIKLDAVGNSSFNFD